MATGSTALHAAANVRNEMERKKIGQVALAELVGMSQSALSRRLLGHIAFDVTELDLIAQALRVPVSRLISKKSA